eukprot:359491-Chlamydomonas_euryale.AAC.11
MLRRAPIAGLGATRATSRTPPRAAAAATPRSHTAAECASMGPRTPPLQPRTSTDAGRAARLGGAVVATAASASRGPHPSSAGSGWRCGAPRNASRTAPQRAVAAAAKRPGVALPVPDPDVGAVTLGNLANTPPALLAEMQLRKWLGMGHERELKVATVRRGLFPALRGSWNPRLLAREKDTGFLQPACQLPPQRHKVRCCFSKPRRRRDGRIAHFEPPNLLD